LLIQRKHWAGILLGVSLIIAGCGRPLQIEAGDQRRPALPTSTPGVETTAVTPDVVATIDATVVPTDTPVIVGDGAPTSPSIDLQTPEPTPEPAASPSPDAPTPEPAEPTPEPSPQPDLADATLPGAQQDYLERWRYVQRDRTPISDTYGEPIRMYQTTGWHWLWWYDPIYGQPVALGQITGEFPVQATFRFRGQLVDGLEVPYEINNSFGIALPDAIVARMRAAGYTDRVEAFVYQTNDMAPQ
jgi:hypothetical protein